MALDEFMGGFTDKKEYEVLQDSGAAAMIPEHFRMLGIAYAVAKRHFWVASRRRYSGTPSASGAQTLTEPNSLSNV